MEYRKSKFNQVVYYEKQGKWYIHNLMHGRFLELSEEEKKAYEEESFASCSKDFYDTLRGEGYLTRDDELADLERKTIETVNSDSDKSLRLVICPTMGCNFACPYCVESGQVHGGKMSKETLQCVMRFFDRLVQKINPETVSIMWYGGEPLLCVDEIETLSKHFQLICKIKHIIYQASIITNGYFLDDKTQERLIKADVISVRVTVDGPKEIHDQTRICRNGEGSYDTIFKNLRALCTKGIHTEIRCNISRNNIDYVEQLENDVKELQKIPGSNIELHFARMMVYRDVPKDQQSVALTEKEYSDFYVEKNDCKKNFIIEPINIPCGACDKNNFTIDELGNIYKCNSFIGDAKHILANVSELPDIDTLFMNPIAKRIREQAFPKADNCRNCLLLPICLGSCPVSTDKRCHPYKHHPEKILIDILEREGNKNE